MHENRGRTAVFLIMFLVSLSLHIQFPIFTPYAVTLGATTFFVSILLSTSSLANLVGHVLSGPIIDRLGKKIFMILPLFGSGLLMMGYSFAHDPHALFILRFANAFILAFLMPSSFALLSTYARTSREQGKNMAIHALLSTIANIIAPLIGGYLVDTYGYQLTYIFVGVSLLASGFLGSIFLYEKESFVTRQADAVKLKDLFFNLELVPIYLISVGLMYGQGTLIYELPFLVIEHGWSLTMTGKLFSYMGAGTLVVVLMFWINAIPAVFRAFIGMLFVGLCFYQLSNPILHLNLSGTLFSIGAGFGILFPAIATLITEKVDKSNHGSAFGILSATFSLGMVISPLVAGAVRNYISPYFLAFVVIYCSVIPIATRYLSKVELNKG